METTLSSLTFLILGFVFAFYAFLVESQDSQPNLASPPPPQPPPSPPPPLLSPPPPSPSPVPVPPSPLHSGLNPSRNHHRKKRRLPPPPPPPPSKRGHKMNTGEKMGLLFVGIGAIMQIGVVVFLVFKRRQLLMVKDAY